MNEQTLTPAVEEVVPVPVPAAEVAGLLTPGKAPKPALEMRPSKPALEARPAEDQLPTARLPSIAPPLPPPVPPPGPAHKTQPLRAITQDAAVAKIADAARRRPWKKVLGQVTRAAAAVPSHLRFGVLRSEAWTERRVGLACAALGGGMIVGALVLGWLSVASDRMGKMEPASLAVAVVLARAALAIATMAVGFGLMRVGERTILASRADAGARAR